jgi:protein prenyltransferase alpha subunit repeat containing protein 1
MSRALDSGEEPAVYNQINDDCYVDVLGAMKAGLMVEKLEIELLGKSHPLPPGSRLLVDGNSIAIPKKTLVSAFLFARSRFASFPSNVSADDEQVIMDTSAIMLLMDAENLTAANARKRVLLATSARNQGEAELLLAQEMKLMDSLLTSPLHRHTKSPTLWNHRKWLVQSHLWKGANSAALNLQHEMRNVVVQAAARHSRNYYAWSYMRWYVSEAEKTDAANSTGMDRDERWPKMLLSLAHETRDWCLKHPDDISGWSFLFHLLVPSPAQAIKQDRPSTLQREETIAIVREILGYTRSFGWRNESVWVFLRSLVATNYVDESLRCHFVEVAEAMIGPGQTVAMNAVSRKNVQAALGWFRDYQQRLSV